MAGCPIFWLPMVVGVLEGVYRSLCCWGAGKGQPPPCCSLTLAGGTLVPGDGSQQLPPPQGVCCPAPWGQEWVKILVGSAESFLITTSHSQHRPPPPKCLFSHPFSNLPINHVSSLHTPSLAFSGL